MKREVEILQEGVFWHFRMHAVKVNESFTNGEKSTIRTAEAAVCPALCAWLGQGSGWAGPNQCVCAAEVLMRKDLS